MVDREEKKVYLYRIIPVKRVKELFENEELVFLKPEAWKDPFENYLSKVQFINSNRTHYIEYLKNVFGQCYSLGRETSLMWDAYTPKSDGVRIKIEKDALIHYLKNQNQFNPKNFEFGNVTYKRYGDFISSLQEDSKLIKLFKNQNRELLKFFFEKRIEYQDEREFRIMYDANNDNKDYGNLLRIKIPVSELIHSVRFDPKMKESECADLKDYFKNKGLDGRKIHRSLLYKYEVNKKVKL